MRINSREEWQIVQNPFNNFLYLQEVKAEIKIIQQQQQQQIQQQQIQTIINPQILLIWTQPNNPLLNHPQQTQLIL